jgi:hypothetical protein
LRSYRWGSLLRSYVVRLFSTSGRVSTQPLGQGSDPDVDIGRLWASTAVQDWRDLIAHVSGCLGDVGRRFNGRLSDTVERLDLLDHLSEASEEDTRPLWVRERYAGMGSWRHEEARPVVRNEGDHIVIGVSDDEPDPRKQVLGRRG